MKKDILKIKEGLRAVPTPYCLQIKAFKHLVERDDTENKEMAQKELAYVYHMVDPRSSYSSYNDEGRRQKEVKKALFGEDTDWVEDGYVRRAMETYEEINLTDAQRLLKSAKKSARTLREYFESVDLTETDDRGKLKWSAKDLINNLSKIGSVIEGIEDLEEKVEKEMVDQGDLRGGVKVNRFSE